MILLIGSSGFIGKELSRRLKARGERFVELNSANGGLLNPMNLQAHRSSGIRHVFHLGSPTSVPESWAKPREFYRAIVEGTSAVLNFCDETGASLTYVSAYVYGNQRNQPIEETRVPAKSNPYAHAKIIAENECLFFRDFRGLRVNVLRPFNIYGPGQSDRFLIGRLLKKALEGSEVSLENTITRRDFIYLADFVDALEIAQARFGSEALFNVGTGRSYAVAEVLAKIETLTGRKLVVSTQNEVRENEILDSVADISRIQRELGWSPKTSLDEGLKLTLQWQRSLLEGQHGTKEYSDQ